MLVAQYLASVAQTSQPQLIDRNCLRNQFISQTIESQTAKIWIAACGVNPEQGIFSIF